MPSTAKKKTPKTVPSVPAIHSYDKVIVRPGSYRVPAKKGSPGAFEDEGGRWVREETFSIDRLNKIAAIAAKMSDEKIKIPAPFAHRDKNKKYVFPVKGDGADALDALHNKPLAWDASINGGFWRDLRFVDDASAINPEFQPGPGLIGTVDTFGDPSDLNSPAGKVSRTVQETSICVLKNYKPPMSDAPYEDYIAHIAMPVHAVEPGQDNFAEVAAMSEESDDDLIVVSMSDLVQANDGADAQEQDDPEMVEVLGFLTQLKIDLPPDTNRDNLISVLRITLRQKIADQKEMTQGNPLTQAPAGSTSKPAPVAMSQSPDAISNALLRRETNRKKDELKRRLKRLKSTGSHELTPELMTELEGEIELVSMSADDLNEDGDFPVSTIEKQIALLERTGRPMTGSLIDDESLFSMSAPDGSHTIEAPVEGIQELSAEYTDAIIARAFG